ncbi:MAG TPA: hypothetical protein VFY89_01905 [Ktedonobacterales bacterium]
MDARPGDARHAPHLLHFTEISNRFATEEPGELMETLVALDDLPGHSGGLSPIATT